MSTTSSHSAGSPTTSWHGFTPASLPQVPLWVERLGRFGHIAKGVVYFIIGLLAFRLAIGAGGEISGARNAIREIGQQPYGRLLLGLVAIGLLGYTVWRWVRAAKDTEGVGKDTKGIVKRIGYAVSGFIYLSLGSFAGSRALGWGNAGAGSSGNQASFLFDSTWGTVLLGVTGLITAGVGLFSISKGYHAKFMEKYSLAEMSNRIRSVALHAGRTGLIARGIAVVIIRVFFISSAWTGTGDGKIKGMGDALAAVAAQPYGMVLLGVAGFGFMAYGVHMVLMGIYGRFNVASS